MGSNPILSATNVLKVRFLGFLGYFYARISLKHNLETAYVPQIISVVGTAHYFSHFFLPRLFRQNLLFSMGAAEECGREDLVDRQIVGFSTGSRIDTDLYKRDLNAAIWRYKPGPGLIHHSDQGVQYANSYYQKLLKQNHIIPSCLQYQDFPATSKRSIFSFHRKIFSPIAKGGMRMETSSVVNSREPPASFTLNISP